MNNDIQNSSKITRGLNIMNLKFWGGWFLAIACVCIFLTMGCESGSLGVKYATVYGRLVNKDNVSMGVPNATVRMVSKETVSGGGELEQGYNFLATVTDANGYFIFEKVQPDNVIFEFSAPGYRKMVFPATSETTEDDGSSSESADIESVTVANGATVDLANILMEKVSVTLPSEISVKLELIDSTTKKKVDDNEYFTVSFDGVAYTKKAKAWRESGVEGVIGAAEITVNVRNESEPVLYNSTTTTISGTSDQYVSVEVTPVTYSLTFQFLGVPSYILSSKTNTPILTLLVEDASTTPAQSIDIVDVKDFAQLAHLDVQAVRNPQHVRLRMNGYRDEVINLTNDLLAGEKGSYRIDVDFQMEDGHSGDDPVTCAELGGKIGMLDNVIRSDIKVNMIGLAPNDKASIVTNFVPESITWSQSYVNSNNETIGLANAEGAITATLKNSPTYFDMTYYISVFPDNPASSSYIITSGDNIVPIGVPETGSTGTAISLDVSKLEASSTSTSE